jgi:methyltransferase (TIGR00027 family)
MARWVKFRMGFGFFKFRRESANDVAARFDSLRPMEHGQPSRTALAAATHRATHQVLEKGMVFSDPLAIRILGTDASALQALIVEADPGRRMRMFIAMRTRFAEDSLAAAIDSGVTQLVVLGAGLDTFAYRSPYGDRLRVFEVDFPATQAWKRERLAAAAIEVPNWLTFAPVDFERQTLADGLAASGFDPAQQTFFTWLGVVPYLSQDAVWATLRFIAKHPGGAHVIFDYSDPPDTLDDETKAYHDIRARRVAELGERWVTYFEAEPLRERLLALGYLEVEDLRPGQLVNRFFPGRGDMAPRRGAHLLRAWTT